ncbi:MAG: DUF4105 domain-containing protein [Polyangia bacterium]|nr:DUF4105 domain-containing protein [Polyangia bacterium]
MRAAALLLCFIGLSGPSSRALAGPETNPSIDLVTMGRSPAIFHRWGHAALCVVQGGEPEKGVCYNYGAIFPNSAASLAWQFLRGTARFMVIQQGYMEMLGIYQREDRTVWIQRMPYSQAQVDMMVGLLENDLKEENRYYTYHHMWDNCATRLRDHLDRVAGGALRRGSQRTLDVTYRELAQRGMAGMPALVLGTTLGFGRGLDRKVTAWASMGHPDYLRGEVARQTGAEPQRIYERQAAPVPDHPGAGQAYLAILALLLGLGVVLGRIGRIGRIGRLAEALPKGLLILLGVVLWLTAAITAVPELWKNEALLVFLPTDVLLFWLAGPRLRLYLRLRLAGLALVAILLVSGIFVQPLAAALLLPALPLLLLHGLPFGPPWLQGTERAPQVPKAPPEKKRR